MAQRGEKAAQRGVVAWRGERSCGKSKMAGCVSRALGGLSARRVYFSQKCHRPKFFGLTKEAIENTETTTQNATTTDLKGEPVHIKSAQHIGE